MKTISQQSKRAMKYFSLFIFIFSFSLVSCERIDSHIVAPTNPDNPQGGAIVGFNTDGVTSTKFEDTHLYGFDAAGKMIMHKYYPTQTELSNDMFQMDNGAYTFIVVLNVGEALPASRASSAICTLLSLLSVTNRCLTTAIRMWSFPKMLCLLFNDLSI